MVAGIEEVLMWTLLATVALADLPPPKGYVETCTLENHPGCEMCSAYHSGREGCEALEKQGARSVCKTRGASVWSEVMCGAAKRTQPVADAPKPDPSTERVPVVPSDREKAKNAKQDAERRCSTGGGGTGWLWMPALLLAVRRR